MRHIVFGGLIVFLALSSGCGPAGGSDADAQASQCLSSAWLAQSDRAGKTLAELVDACNQRTVASAATETVAAGQ